MSLKIGPKPVGLAARKMAAQKEGLLVIDPTLEFKKLNPLDMPDRIGIVFDDSGSMGGYTNYVSPENTVNLKIVDAHAGVEEFLRSCSPGKTAVTIYPMNMPPMKISCDLITMAMQIKTIEAIGGTPLIATLHKMLKENNLTRSIVFSDGYPNDARMDYVVGLAKELKVPVDTVYFGGDQPEPIRFMKELAERTGGIFLHFDPSKMNFRTAFKYLSPGYYGMLADKSFVADIEAGRKS